MAQRRAKTMKAGPLPRARVLVIEARYYDDIADGLLAGATAALDEAKVRYDVVTVPGALEIPAALAILCEAAARARKPYDGVVALGCVIRGETSHYDIVANQSARALMDLSVARLLPIGNAILTVDTEAQALARARPQDLDKGGFAARAVLTMIRIGRAAAPPKRRR